MEGKNRKLILALVLSVSMVIVAVAGSFILLRSCNIDLTPATVDEVPLATTHDETEDDTSEAPSEVPTTEIPTLPNGEVYTLTQDWDTLKGINTDIKAWIHIPGTVINYPVLSHPTEWEYYLHRNYDKSYLFAGSVFIDYRSVGCEKARHVITHAHNMNNGTMYAALVDYGKYTGNLDAYRNAPVIFFNTPDGVEQWIIFSVYKTSTLDRHGKFFNYLFGDFESDAQYMNYIYSVRERSLFDVPVPINENDRILTLSTCSYEYSDFRTVVVARKVRPGESVKAYIDDAELNPDPLWPDVYYTDHSVDPPDVTTFKTEYDKNNVSWYDGKGNLKGNEWLPSAGGKEEFTVSFTDCNGTIISTQTVPYGRDATPPPDPQKPDDEYYIYEFAGWQLDYTNVNRNMIIAPSYNPILKEKWR